MSRVKTINLSGVTANPQGVAANQTPGAAGDLTLTGNAPPVTMIIDIESTGNDSARTFTVEGTDRYGESISEDVTGASIGVAQTTKQFQTVTRVAIDGAAAGIVRVGWAAVVYSRWLPLATEFGEIEVGLGVTVTGTVNFDLEYTYVPLQRETVDVGGFPRPENYADAELRAASESFVDADIIGDTASVAKQLTSRATAIRFKMNSGTGSIVARITEAENR